VEQGANVFGPIPSLLGLFFLMIQGCGSLFWKSPSFARNFNGLQHSFQVWQGFINVSELFSYKDSLFILATTRKEDFRINSTFRSDFLVYLELLKGDKSDPIIFRILIRPQGVFGVGEKGGLDFLLP